MQPHASGCLKVAREQSRQFRQALLVNRKISLRSAGKFSTSKPPRVKTSVHKRSSAWRVKTMSLGRCGNSSANRSSVVQSPSAKWQAHNTTGIVLPLNHAAASSNVRAVCNLQLDPWNAARSLLRSSAFPLTARTSVRTASGADEFFNCKV
jgi:hypothetical protein